MHSTYFVQYSRKQVLNGMKDLLPQRLIPVVLDMSYVDENKFINQVSREERHRLLQTLKHFVITISATRPIAEAIVTAGGVSVKEIDPKTMGSSASGPALQARLWMSTAIPAAIICTGGLQQRPCCGRSGGCGRIIHKFDLN